MHPSDLVTQLVGVAPFTQAGCEATLSNTSASITKDGITVLSAHKSPSEALWKIDLAQIPTPAIANQGRYLMHFVFNNYHHIEICSSLDGADTADAYKKGLEVFEAKGHLIDFIRIDNVTSPPPPSLALKAHVRR